jgi:hypothetical protein
VKVNGQIKGDHILIVSEETFDVSASILDPNGDKLKITWQVIPESTDIRSGGDAENAPQPIPGSVMRSKGETAKLRAPQKEGAYRVYLTITDGNGHYAYANVPFYVVPRDKNAAPAKAVSFKKMTL